MFKRKINRRNLNKSPQASKQNIHYQTKTLDLQAANAGMMKDKI